MRFRRLVTSLLLGALWWVTWAASASAQRAPSPLTAQPPQLGREIDLRPPLLSLVVPGGGQHLLGQDRKWAYAALEVVGWALFVERRHAGSDYRDRYRDYAWENGRLQGAARVDGSFEYYERLAHWTRSGAFDRDGNTPGVQPELDESTFNGSVWSLAARIFLGGSTTVPESHPAYADALAYYGERAYAPDFLWDWGAAPDAHARYADLLDASDSRFRQATTVLGVIIANHVFSAADAYLSARGRASLPRIRIMPDAQQLQGWSLVMTVARFR